MLDVKSEFNGGDEQEKMLAVKTEAIAKMCIEKEQFTDDGKSFYDYFFLFPYVKVKFKNSY